MKQSTHPFRTTMIRTILHSSHLAFACSTLAILSSVPTAAQLTLHSGPVGVISRDLVQGENGLAFPLIAADTVVGLAEGNAGTVLSFPDTEGDIGALLAAGTSYYVEIVTGPLEGERLDVDEIATMAATNATLVLDLGPASHSTLNVLGANVLDDARCVIRPHVTLSSLQAMISPVLAGDNKHNMADGVHVFEGGEYRWYFLKADGVSWAGKDVPGDFRHRVIPPDTSIKLEVRSGAKSWMHEGIVRTSAFRKNLMAGTQAFATGYPEALSPLDLAAFVDPNSPPAIRWTGNADPEVADWIQLSARMPKPFHWYYLTADGLSWRRVAQSIVATDVPFVEATEAILLRRQQPDAGYIILPPFDL